MINAFLALTTQVPTSYQSLIDEVQYSLIYHSMDTIVGMTFIYMEHIANTANSL